MNNKYELIYEGKAKKVFSHDESDKVLIEFKDDATAFNALKKAILPRMRPTLKITPRQKAVGFRERGVDLYCLFKIAFCRENIVI